MGVGGVLSEAGLAQLPPGLGGGYETDLNTLLMALRSG